MDTVTRAKIAANSRWSNQRPKNTAVIYVDSDLAKRLKSKAKADKKAVGDYLRDAIAAYDETIAMLDTLDTDNAELKEQIAKVKKYSADIHALENID